MTPPHPTPTPGRQRVWAEWAPRRGWPDGEGHAQHPGLPVQAPPVGKALLTAWRLCLCHACPLLRKGREDLGHRPCVVPVVLPPRRGLSSPAFAVTPFSPHPVLSDLREPFPPGSDPGLLPPQGPSCGVVQSGIRGTPARQVRPDEKARVVRGLGTAVNAVAPAAQHRSALKALTSTAGTQRPLLCSSGVSLTLVTTASVSPQPLLPAQPAGPCPQRVLQGKGGLTLPGSCSHPISLLWTPLCVFR